MRNWTVHGVNFDVLSILLRDMAEQWIYAIRNQLDSFSYQAKDNPDKLDDQVTSADYAAQKAIVDMITKCFPEAWIIAEENNLKKPCTHPIQQLYFTLDPLDGTKAYVRMQSDGIGSMIGVVLDDEIIWAAVADIMTKEIYLLNPATGSVERHHPRRFLTLEYMHKNHMRLAMVDDPRHFTPVVSAISHPWTWFFSSISVTNGSIWTNVARIWKNEASAFLAKENAHVTPWDRVPVTGISQALGFVFLAYNEQTGSWDKVDKPWSLDVSQTPDTLLIHISEVDNFLAWVDG